jgi:PAS domain S-box-containing protein
MIVADAFEDADRTALARALFEELGDALFLIDPETTQVLDANPMAQHLSGYSREQLLGKETTYLFRSQDKGGRSRLHLAARKTGVFHSQEGFYLRTPREGVWIPVNLTISRLHVPSKTLCLLTARDLREQREGQNRLRSAEAELRRVLDSVSDSLWSAEIDGMGTWKYHYFSSVIEKITGRPPEFFCEGLHRWGSIVHADDKVQWQRALARMRSGEASREEYRILTPDHRIRWLRESVLPGRGPDDRSLRLHGVISDITDRRQAEEVLTITESRYRTLIENLTQSVFLKDEQLRFVVVNRPFCQGLGRAAAEIIGKTDFDFYPPGLAEKYKNDDLRVLNEGIRLEQEEQSVVNGRTRMVRVVKTPVLNVQGRVTGVLGIFWDITDQRALEAQLRHAQKMEAIGQLAGGVAHDFNNLLTVITGYSELLLQGLAADDASHRIVSEIRKAGERAARLTHQLLAFSRKQILAPVLLDLNAIVSDMEKMLRRLIGEDIELITVPDPALGRVKADPGQIEQVIVNLAVNARDAMPRGGKLTLATANVFLDEPYGRTHEEIAPGGYAMLAVADTGCGMDEETKSHLFEPFFTTKEVGKGTGLGLATVYGIVKQSGGHVEVDSRPGQGSTFKIFLPLAAEPDTGFAPQPADANHLQGRETILLVEDEVAVRRLALRILRQCGYTVMDAENGPEALSMVEAHAGPLDLLLTDVVMPRMSGRQLADQLLALRPQLKVLFLSGYTDDAIVRHGVQDTEVRFLQKPFTSASLARKVRQVLDQASNASPTLQGS